VNANTQVWISELDISAKKTEAFYNSYTSTSNQVKNQFQALAIKPYVPTASTPFKRTFTYPQQLTRTRPETEIVAQYRNGGVLPTCDSNSETYESAKDVSYDTNNDDIEETTSECCDSPDQIPYSTQQVSPRKGKGTRPVPQGRQAIQQRAKSRKQPATKEPVPMRTRGDGGRENSGTSFKRGISAKAVRQGDSDTGASKTVPPPIPAAVRESQRTRLGDLTNQVKL